MPPAEPGRSSADERRHLLDVLAAPVQSRGFDLEDVSVALVGRRRLVRVVVDADGGVDLDGIAAVSRVVSAVLDDADDANGGIDFAGPYVLEVTSPGVERPLSEPRHWHRSIGRLVRVDFDSISVTGRVLDVDERGVRLDVNGEVRTALWDGIGPGQVQVEFNRADGPGQE
ncbi:MAG: ribosome maturation factor RimP [Actinomycetota bacterium]